MAEESKGSHCPKCQSRNASVYKTAGELMLPDENDEIDGMFAIVPGVPDILQCNNCNQLFDEKGNLWTPEDLGLGLGTGDFGGRHPDADFGIDIFE